jgi:hypothetical protein
MANKKDDPAKYGSYSQYAFRASRAEIEGLQKEIDALYDKFNKGRDSKDPQGRRAENSGEIALAALKIGIVALQKRQKWEFK